MKNIAIICGGVSPEHIISMRSAQTILNNIDRENFTPIVLGMSEQGKIMIIRNENLPIECLNDSGEECEFLRDSEGVFVSSRSFKKIRVDLAFPIIHGSGGEDGAIQGFLQFLGIPFVGPGIFGTSITMRKDKARAVISGAGIKSIPFFLSKAPGDMPYKDVTKLLKSGKLVIKPVDSGSSIGISVINDEAEFESAILDALKYSPAAMIEPYVKGFDLECSVLDGRSSRTSAIFCSEGYETYSYEAKYIDKEAVKIDSPYNCSKELEEYVKNVSARIAKILECSEMSRIDYRVSETNEVYFSEINTIPGFVDISVFPKSWRSEGMSTKKLITKLLEDALTKHKSKQKYVENYQAFLKQTKKTEDK